MRHITEDMTPDQLAMHSAHQLKLWRDEMAAMVVQNQNSLGNQNKTDDIGRRLTFTEFSDWKVRARHALQYKLAALRRIKTAHHEAINREQQEKKKSKSYDGVKFSVLVRMLLSELEGVSVYPVADSVAETLREMVQDGAEQGVAK